MDYLFGNRGRIWGRALAASALMAAGACDLTDTGMSGELGRGTFFYECDNNPDDGFCDRDVLDREFPAAVAVDAFFRIDYEPDGSGQYDVVSGCLDCIDRTAEGFVMHEPGRGPLLVENGNGEIFDILHIEAKEATAVVVRVDGEPWPDGEVLMTLGSMHDMGATPQAADGTELGGALDYSWEIGDDTVVQAISSGERNDVEFAAIGAGETTVTVTAGALTYEIPVRVEEVG